jgi:hypothetical protein
MVIYEVLGSEIRFGINLPLKHPALSCYYSDKSRIEIG